MKKAILLGLGSVVLCSLGMNAFADVSGVGFIAQNVTSNLANVAKLITAGSYVAGLGCAVAAIVKFKGHKDNPTQVPIGMPIALLFVAAALVFIPPVLKSSGATLFGGSATVAGVSGITGFGAAIAPANK